MRILICTTQVPFTTGGAESHVEGLRHALIEAGHRAETVALPFKWYPPTEIMRSAMAWRLLDLAAANGQNVDLVVGMKFPAYLVEHANKVLWILHQHRSAYNLWGTQFDDLSTYPEGPRVREWIKHCDEKFIPAAKKVFANSRTVADRLRSYNHLDSEVLYHPPPLADRLKSGTQRDFIFCPSRMEPQKRQELLIEAMKYVRAPVKAVFAGNSSDPKHYQSLIKQHAVADRVCVRGFVSDDELIDLYASALAVAYLPFDEDYGYVTLQSMLAAKPVIVPTDGGGATEFVEDGVTGSIVKPDPQAIAESIDQLHSDRERARRIGEQARDRISSANLSWSNVVGKILNAA
jgi:glycosyltransferase involved in cell wall biosynthesis